MSLAGCGIRDDRTFTFLAGCRMRDNLIFLWEQDLLILTEGMRDSFKLDGGMRNILR